MAMSSLQQDYTRRISEHPDNAEFTAKGWQPIFSASESAKIAIIGQAPGLAAQESQIPWNDVSGKKLIEWLSIDSDTFYDASKIALLPMDFYYPGKNPKGGDLPPRKGFANKWHAEILSQMPNIELKILVGAYSQKHYLGKAGGSLTENVKQYTSFLPEYFPIVHPSPLAGRWRAKNPWFETEVVPELQSIIAKILAKPS